MGVPLQRNTAGQIRYVFIFDGADLKFNPTIAAGDFTRSIGGAAFANMDVLPVAEPAGGPLVKFAFSQAESNCGTLAVAWSDQAGGDWSDGGATWDTDTATFGTLSIAISAIGTTLAAITAAIAAIAATLVTMTATLATILAAVNTVCTCVISALLNISPIRRTLKSVDLGIYRGDTWIQPIAKLGDISTATEIWFTAKRDKDDTDAQADILISSVVGLEVINQTAATVAGNASITVTDAVAGNITVRLEAVEAAKVTTEKSHWYYDVQWTDGTDVETPRRGQLTPTGDVGRMTS